MLGKREEGSVLPGGKEFSQDSQEELDRIYQLHQKRRPWTTNFKVFLEKELGMQIGQGLVHTNSEEKFEKDVKFKELLELFNKKQARLASEVVGEENNTSSSNNKLDITNASTAAEDSQNGFFVTPVKQDDDIGLSQYEKLLAATINSLAHPEPAEAPLPETEAKDERRNAAEMEVEAAKQATDLQLELPVDRQSAVSESLGWQEEQESSELADVQQGDNQLFVPELQLPEPVVEQTARFKRISSFDMLTDTDLEGFIFEKEDYCIFCSYLVDSVRTLLIQDGFNALYL